MLISFGIVRREDLAFSDPERTILDFLYLSKYGRIWERTTRNMLIEYGEELDWDKVSRYLCYYRSPPTASFRGATSAVASTSRGFSSPVLSTINWMNSE